MTLRTILRQPASAAEQLDKHPLCLVGFTTIIYLGIVSILASEKLFWNDELYTFYISRLDRLSDVWQALLTGVEQLPPLFFIITRGSTALFGSSGFAFRLPQILGFWLMSVSLFCFVRRRSSAAYGLVAMLFPLITMTFYYAYEARPYGLVLGFCGLALYCWQAATEGRLRVLSVTGLGLSLVGALSCHYYAILAFVPLILGEALRTVRSGRLDFGIWIAFGVGLIPLAIFLPLIRASAGYSHNFWGKPNWADVISFYIKMLAPGVPFVKRGLVVVIILIGIYSFARSSTHGGTTRPANSIPIHETAAVVGFALFPLGAMILAKTITNAFVDRYALPAVIGISAIFAWTLFRWMDRRPRLGLAVAAIILATFVAKGLWLQRSLAVSVNEQAATYQFLRSNDEARIPVVIQDPHLFFALSHYAVDKGGSRLIYLSNVALALKYTGTDTVERGLLELRKWAPLDIEDYRRFCASHSEFLIYSYPGGPFAWRVWLIPELKRQGWRLVIKAKNGNQFLFLVTSENAQSDKSNRDLGSLDRPGTASDDGRAPLKTD